MRMPYKYIMVIVCVALLASAAFGHTFSVDRFSTSALQGGLLSDDVLTPGPTLHVSAAALGLFPSDDINALSGGLDTHAEDSVIFFSVWGAAAIGVGIWLLVK